MKILCFGSLNIDRVYRVDDFVRGGETRAAQSLNFFPGGKGLNQSVAIARAGGQVYHAGAVGPDGEGLVSQLAGAGVRLDYLLRREGPSGHTVIQVSDSGQNAILICPGANGTIESGDVGPILDDFSPGDLVLLQNELSCVDVIMSEAHRRGLFLVLNPSPITPELLRCPLELVDLLILNEHEAAALGGRPGEAAALDALRNKCPRAAILLTLGERGCRYMTPHGTELKMGAFRVQAVDTTGAGDTFCGYFLAGLSQGLSPEDNLRRASAAAALAVTRSGASTSIPHLTEVEHFLTIQL